MLYIASETIRIFEPYRMTPHEGLQPNKRVGRMKEKRQSFNA